MIDAKNKSVSHNKYLIHLVKVHNNERRVFNNLRFNQTKSITDMKKVFGATPNFDKYNDTNSMTSRLKLMWSNKKKCGGPIT